MVAWKKEAIIYLALASGFSTLFYAFYYMQQLSYSIGFYRGVQSVSANATLNTSALVFALHVTYIMLVFSVLILLIGVMWLFSKSHYKRTSIAMGFAAIIYLLLSFLLQSNLTFSSAAAHTIFLLSYLAGMLGVLSGVISFMESYSFMPKRIGSMARQMEINPATPYTNMLKLSKRLGLSGTVKILDMHMDYKALEHLLRMLGEIKDRYTELYILTTRERLGSDFEKGYLDFRDEITNAGVAFELRILDQDDARKQHERIIMDNSKAYKIPPLNIINRKSEHIVSINNQNAANRFNDLWSRATKFENVRVNGQ